MIKPKRVIARLFITFILVACVWLPQLRSVSFYQTSISSQTKNNAKRPVHKRLTKSSLNTTTFKLLQSDSIYHHYNMSTTPIVLEQHKLILFTCEKVGSTVLRQLARRMMNYSDYDYHGEGIPHVIGRNGLKYLHQFPRKEAEHMLVSDKWIKAMFVRDPKERALSGFLMWRPHPPKKNLLEQARRGEVTEPVIGANDGKPGMLAVCCQQAANGDYNLEVLCLHRVYSFDGFLDMIEDPKSIIDIGQLEKERYANPIKYWLRKSPSCPDKHWSPITHWRMEHKFYPLINFMGHLETAAWDIKRLLDKVSPTAFEEYGASGWGLGRNESMFQSSSTVLHAKDTSAKLKLYYTTLEIEKRVEHIFRDDYENKFFELNVVKIGEAEEYYKRWWREKYGDET
ncbi:hypothetical protein ACHAWO_011465 [Cyclotella atomus]|uniref:Sulfotransferase domain-containing protein n=1 Tax=Cyclotella atomus TaxID=382360 RepID=A0ABD3QWV4_9STRA